VDAANIETTQVQPLGAARGREAVYSVGVM
jgi:hypothetical protein